MACQALLSPFSTLAPGESRGTGQGYRGYPAAATATSTQPAAGWLDQGTPCTSRLADFPRGVGGRLGSRGGLAEIQASPQTPIQPCGEGESRGARAGVRVSTHWGDLGQTSLLPPSPGRIRTLGGGCAGPSEGHRLSPPQHDVWGWQRLLLCSCLCSHPSSSAPGRAPPAPHHPLHGQGSPSQPRQQSPAPPCPG